MDKKDFVHDIFEKIAKDYDQMNEIISFGRNHAIKKQMVNTVPFSPDAKILDICTGTGDIAIYASKSLNNFGKVIAVDFSQNMLDIASKKAKDIKNIEFIKADALQLPFSDEKFDVCFISYGLRNLENLKKGLLEIKRVTKKGGYIINLDLGKPKGLLNIIYRLYFFNMVPLLGKIIHGNHIPYKYLPESSNDFPSQEELVNILIELGYSEVKNYNFAFGAIAGQIAIKLS